MSDMTKKPLTLDGVMAYVRHEVLTWPNLFTFIRFWCAVGMFVLSGHSVIVFWLALFGALSDVIDGWLAKRFGLGTDFGKRFDQYMDWWFGFALVYTICVAGGLAWDVWPYNGELFVLIVGYLVVRTLFLKAETLWVAKVKTGMQFVGGVVILAGFAGLHLTFGDYVIEYTVRSIDLINAGYLLVWSSTSVMAISLRDYARGWLAQRK